MMSGSDAGDAGEAKKLLEKRLSESLKGPRKGGGGASAASIMQNIMAVLQAIASPFITVRDYLAWSFRAGGALHRATTADPAATANGCLG